MITYLQEGWFSDQAPSKLRPEVVDGAMDVAGWLMKAGVKPPFLQAIALKIRHAFSLIDPQMHGTTPISSSDREKIAQRLEFNADDPIEVDAFIADCLEHVNETNDLLGLYLHLIHISRMVALLGQATKTAP